MIVAKTPKTLYDKYQLSVCNIKRNKVIPIACG